MNKCENEGNFRAIDSLINFETVKLFGNEKHESDRFHRYVARLPLASRSPTEWKLPEGAGVIWDREIAN
jgi:ABC-type transport system involved in Fe-S cluster assembly fused permease/ATPase subunit